MNIHRVKKTAKNIRQWEACCSVWNTRPKEKLKSKTLFGLLAKKSNIEAGWLFRTVKIHRKSVFYKTQFLPDESQCATRERH